MAVEPSRSPVPGLGRCLPPPARLSAILDYFSNICALPSSIYVQMHKKVCTILLYLNRSKIIPPSKNLFRGADFSAYKILLWLKTKTRSLENLNSLSFIINYLEQFRNNSVAPKNLLRAPDFLAYTRHYFNQKHGADTPKHAPLHKSTKKNENLRLISVIHQPDP